MIDPNWIAVGVSVLTSIAAGGYAWGQRNAMEKYTESTISDLTDQLRKLWAWKDARVEQDNAKELNTQKIIAELSGRVSNHDEVYRQILKALDEIKQDIKELRK